MKKKYKRALAAALAAVMIWNTCDWHPQALAGSSVQYIEEVKELSDEILHQEVPYGAAGQAESVGFGRRSTG